MLPLTLEVPSTFAGGRKEILLFHLNSVLRGWKNDGFKKIGEESPPPLPRTPFQKGGPIGVDGEKRANEEGEGEECSGHQTGGP